MGDDGDDVQVCGLCEEILMSMAELEDHMKEEHPPKKEEKVETIAKAPEPVKRPMSSCSEEGGKKKRSRSRSVSPKRPAPDFMNKLVSNMDKDKDAKRRDEKKMKKHKHRDRSRSKERHGDKQKEKEKMKKSSHGHGNSSDDEERNRRKHEEEKKKWKAKDDASKGKSSNDHRNGSPDDFVVDDEEAKRKKMKKFREADEHKSGSSNPVIGGNREQGAVLAHDNVDGPVCFKCQQVCKDNGNLKNHVLSHYYQEFYKVTPDAKPYPCPECAKENRDRITMIRHFAFAHGKIYELTEVTPEDLKATGKLGQGPKTYKPREPKEKKKVDIDNGNSSDDDKKEKKKDWSHHFAGAATDKNSEELRMKFGKHKDHKDAKHKKEKKSKDHKKNETEEERRIRKEKKRAEKDKERKHSKDGSNPLSSLLKELTPDSNGSPAATPRHGETVIAGYPGEPKKRIAHAASSEPPSPEPAAGALDPVPDPPTPKAARQEDESDDDDDFGDLPVPVYAE